MAKKTLIELQEIATDPANNLCLEQILIMEIIGVTDYVTEEGHAIQENIILADEGYFEWYKIAE